MQSFPTSILRFLSNIHAVLFNYWSVEFTLVLSFCYYDLYKCYSLVCSFILSLMLLLSSFLFLKLFQISIGFTLFKLSQSTPFI